VVTSGLYLLLSLLAWNASKGLLFLSSGGGGEYPLFEGEIEGAEIDLPGIDSSLGCTLPNLIYSISFKSKGFDSS